MAKTLQERFWEKVDKKGPDECWEWTASTNTSGYGQINRRGRMVLAHRLSYEMNKGSIPENLYILHKCDNKKCVNPKHLELGTYSKNIKDAYDRGLRITPRGENNPMVKLTPIQISKIRDSKLPQKELVKLYGVTRQQIWRIKQNKSWRDANN